ncbi:MAG: hypothetical protein LBT62_06090 [Deltaproteobacteria bacterium]|nr:hypothetical protein [Deltaproteobacteria bacterium]
MLNESETRIESEARAELIDPALKKLAGKLSRGVGLGGSFQFLRGDLPVRQDKGWEA